VPIVCICGTVRLTIINVDILVIYNPNLGVIIFYPLLVVLTICSCKTPVVTKSHSCAIMNYKTAQIIAVIFNRLSLESSCQLLLSLCFFECVLLFRVPKHLVALMNLWLDQSIFQNVKFQLFEILLRLFIIIWILVSLFWRLVNLILFDVKQHGKRNFVTKFFILHSIEVHFEPLEMS